MDDRAAFEKCVESIVVALFIGFPGQREVPFKSADISPNVCFVSVFAEAPADEPDLHLVETGFCVEPVRRYIASFLQRHEVVSPDIVFVVSSLVAHEAALATEDDEARGGIPFELDGKRYLHCYWCKHPGVSVLHLHSHWYAIVHELQHAVGSSQNGRITDLYLDAKICTDLVNKQLRTSPGAPVPPSFGTYAGRLHHADQDRQPIGYPGDWHSYHCARHNPAAPAIMDDYRACPPHTTCENDTITREFMLDRIRAKLAR